MRVRCRSKPYDSLVLEQSAAEYSQYEFLVHSQHEDQSPPKPIQACVTDDEYSPIMSRSRNDSEKDFKNDIDVIPPSLCYLRPIDIQATLNEFAMKVQESNSNVERLLPLNLNVDKASSDDEDFVHQICSELEKDAMILRQQLEEMTPKLLPSTMTLYNSKENLENIDIFEPMVMMRPCIESVVVNDSDIHEGIVEGESEFKCILSKLLCKSIHSMQVCMDTEYDDIDCSENCSDLEVNEEFVKWISKRKETWKLNRELKKVRESLKFYFGESFCTVFHSVHC